MCGIFGYLGNKPNAAELTLTGLKTLEYRGYDSWGIAIQNQKSKIKNQNANLEADSDLTSSNYQLSTISVEKHIGKIGEAMTSLPGSSLAIGHTRWATHGGVTDENAHPHLNTAKTIAVVHNGIIENYQELRTSLRGKDIDMISETDTEVVAHLIDWKMRDGALSFKDAVLSTFRELVGSNAIVAMDAASHEIIACRDGSPLVVGIGTDESILASDVTALLPFTRQVCFLDDGESIELTRHGIHLYDTRDGTERPLRIEQVEWSVEAAQKGGYPHYMLKEIMEQTHTLTKSLHINQATIAQLGLKIRDAKKVFVVGCGSASHVGIMSQYFFASAGISAQALAANEFLPFAGFCDSATIVIAISQSGETAETLIAARAAKARGATIVAIVNARASTLERLADVVLPVGTGPEISVVSTKANTAQLATMYALAFPASQVAILADKLTQVLASWLTDDLLHQVQDIATQILDHQDIYVIGKYACYPAALETALKIKEASYIHAEGFAAGELKHGVIALIQKSTPCIVLASDDQAKSDIFSSAIELKTRGAQIIGIAPFAAPEWDIYIPTPDLGDFTPVTNIIAGQLLGYYLSLGRAADPDKPRNLAKSVTVK